MPQASWLKHHFLIYKIYSPANFIKKNLAYKLFFKLLGKAIDTRILKATNHKIQLNEVIKIWTLVTTLDFATCDFIALFMSTTRTYGKCITHVRAT